MRSSSARFVISFSPSAACLLNNANNTGLADAYIDGDLTSTDLPAFVRLLIVNQVGVSSTVSSETAVRVESVPRSESSHACFAAPSSLITAPRACALSVCVHRPKALREMPLQLQAKLLRALQEQSRVPQPPVEWIQAEDAIRFFVDVFDQLVARMRERIDKTADDQVTQDLLIEITAALEKHYWMWQAENQSR